MTKKILIINGPNLNLLGEREESKYGKITLEEVKKNCESHAKSIGLEIKFEPIFISNGSPFNCIFAIFKLFIWIILTYLNDKKNTNYKWTKSKSSW